jgi:hypothetical protein
MSDQLRSSLAPWARWGRGPPACVCSGLVHPALVIGSPSGSRFAPASQPASSRPLVSRTRSINFLSHAAHCSLSVPPLFQSRTLGSISMRHTARGLFAQQQHTYVSYSNGQGRDRPRATTTKRRMRFSISAPPPDNFFTGLRNFGEASSCPLVPLRRPRYPLAHSVRHIRAGHGWAERDSIHRSAVFPAFTLNFKASTILGCFS